MKLFKSKKVKEEKMSKHERALLREYELGRVLQVDNQKDNKEYFKSLEDTDGPEEIAE